MAITDNQAIAKRVAILVEQGFQDYEFQVPYTALRQGGAKVTVLGSRMNEQYQGKHGKVLIRPDGTTTEARVAEFDAVIIPGGGAPDRMRTNPNTVKFVQDAAAYGLVLAAICRGPQLLISADLLRGRRATGFFSIRKDIENAGATYIDEPLVIDEDLITSRQPGDLAFFATAILSRLELGMPNQALPDGSDLPIGDSFASRTAQWWQLAEAWGGSTKSEIVDGLNTALAGERYTQEAFSHYAQKTSDEATRLLLLEIAEHKLLHIKLLEGRLQALGEQASLPANAAGALATFMSLMQSSDDLTILRNALGDVQTGVVDSYHLRTKYTDPVSTAIFTEIETTLGEYERRLANLYQERLGFKTAQPAQPTTPAAVA